MIEERLAKLMLNDFWLSSGKSSVIELTKHQRLRFKIQVEYDRSLNIGTMVDLNHGRLMFYLPEKQRYRSFAFDKIVSLELLDGSDQVLVRCSNVKGLEVLQPDELKQLGITIEGKKD